MEKSRKSRIPWLLIAFLILASLKFTVAPGMSLWIVFAPLLIPIAFLAFLIVFLLIAELIVWMVE